jgi:hypothetical protein
MVATVTELSHDQQSALQIAHTLADLGMPVFALHRDSLTGEFLQRPDWQHTKPGQVSHNWINQWRPGMALCGVTGVAFDVIDIDPRNGGLEGARELAAGTGWHEATVAPWREYGRARTPSGGEHILIGRTHIAKTSKAAKGVDLQAGDDQGNGRGFVYLAPTERMSKWGPCAGQMAPYVWEWFPDNAQDVWLQLHGQEDPGLVTLAEYVQGQRGQRRVVSAPAAGAHAETDNDLAAFGDLASDWTPAEANRVIEGQLQAVVAAREGEINNALGGAARVLGRFVASGYLEEGHAAEMLLEALDAGGVHSDQWNLEHGKKWTAATVIGAGLANGAKEPWTVDSPAVQTQPVDARTQSPAPVSQPPASVALAGDAGERGPEVVIPLGSGRATSEPPPFRAPAAIRRYEVLSAADSAYWLQNELGTNGLSGFFLKAGRVVHTPLVDETGYVKPRADADDNGPAQIQAVNPGQLAAKVQYAYSCYKTIKGKDGKPDTTVPALFSGQAAQRAIDAPEAMAALRPLAGLTLTPMVRADGSVLERPGYDEASRYLFLPGPGMSVAPVPERPSAGQVDQAVALLDEMLAGFPWSSKDDRANFLGLLLSPMLRLVAPPTYKMFGISAHQPGSGKTLLADIVTILHGGVLRSEVPEDEPEWRKQTTSILATTSAPVIHIDNVTGLLKSSVLAGLLTAGQATSDRLLGTSEMVTTVNDRVWVVTGNNLSLGGDLVRRTITIMIDPNTPNPEAREFDIGDLKGWVKARRNELLWALLVMVRAWVAAGQPTPARPQSDSFARWESVVAGILEVCRIDGDFDRESGKRAAGGGDDDDTASVLAHLASRFGARAWTVGEALDGTEHADVGDFVAASRDWLPASVLDRLARSEAAGRKAFGYWLRNRVGRWVTDTDGHAYVIRTHGKTNAGIPWSIEQM